MKTGFSGFLTAIEFLCQQWKFGLLALITLGGGILLNSVLVDFVGHAVLSRGNEVRPALELQTKPCPASSIKGSRVNVNLDGLAVLNEIEMELEWQANRQAVSTARVTSEFFSILGIHPLMGRIFSGDDDQNRADPVAMISFQLWENRFQADPTVVGSRIQLDDKFYEVVGVMPADIESRSFGWMTDIDVWLPLNASRVDETEVEVVLALL